MPDPQPTVNIGSPAAMSEHKTDVQAAAVAAAPPAVVVAPAPVAQPAIQPVQPAPVAVDMPVIMPDGKQVPLNEIQAGYQAAMDMGLDDADNRDFLMTVSLAQRGDAGALSRIEAMVTANAQEGEVPPSAPTAVGMQPASEPVAPVAHPQAQPALRAAPSPAPIIDTNSIISHLRETLTPLVDRIKKMEPFVQGKIQTDQLAALRDTFDNKKDQFPHLNISAENSAPRILQIWNEMVAGSIKAKSVQPNHQDLQRLLESEERYLSSAVPAPVPSANVVRDDSVDGRISGLPVPGRIDLNALNQAQLPAPPIAPTASQVSTNMPVVGTPSPAPQVTAEVAVPRTLKDLKAKIEADLAGMGVNTRS